MIFVLWVIEWVDMDFIGKHSMSEALCLKSLGLAGRATGDLLEGALSWDVSHLGHGFSASSFPSEPENQGLTVKWGDNTMLLSSKYLHFSCCLDFCQPWNASSSAMKECVDVNWAQKEWRNCLNLLCSLSGQDYTWIEYQAQILTFKAFSD